MPIANFSNAEMRLLRRMARKFRQQTRMGTPPEEFMHQAPEVYIAYVPSGGIAGLTVVGTGVGSGDYDTPGSTTCSVYRINADGDIAGISGLTKLVYNLSQSKITEGWITIARTKGGKWIAVSRHIDFDRCNATLKGAITATGTGSTTTTVDNVKATRGSSPLEDPTDVTEELTVDNFFQWDADDNAPCKIEYNHDDDTWEMYQVECPA